jgi:hypothetical protein
MSLRDAAQQALGALYIAQDDCVHGEMAEPSPIFEEAITALETALAESKSDTSSDYERGFIDGMQKQMQSSVDKAVNRMAVLAEPQPEPVALPQRQPLTDMEIARLCVLSLTEAERIDSTPAYALARAIERAHGIGGDK